MAADLDLGQPASLIRVDRLLRRWAERSTTEPTLRLRPGQGPAHGAALWGLTAHVYAQAARIRPLIDHGEGIELAPVVRAMLECSLRAQWLAQRGPKALPSFLHDGARQRLNLGTSMMQAAWVGMSAEIIERLQEDVPSKGELDEQARRFERMLNDFDSGTVLYTFFRFLSGLSHPSTSLIDAYTDTDERTRAVSLRHRAALDGAEATWTWLIVLALVWAWSALDSVSSESPDRHYLRSVARETGTAAMLELSAEAKRQKFLDEYEAGRRPRT
ncbi:DUF5677 domain-containing protein [Blastococcus aggregatus]|nr:DUF5677 domain-containing protein [Blastococcus aggregatus]